MSVNYVLFVEICKFKLFKFFNYFNEAYFSTNEGLKGHGAFKTKV